MHLRRLVNMNNEKGGLIKKNKKPIMEPPAPVIKTQATDFSYSTAPASTTAPVEEETKQPVVKQPVTQQPAKEPTEQKQSKAIGKKNSTKTLKVPSELHTKINLLGPFMDENKAYMILQRLVNSYIANELSDRQQRQFEFMVGMSEEEN